ncbi:hypothetical protein R8Z50_21905 [Longispora sp. K20-0274]|uniref:hypothetical protein n=1 Tax=Longispora sp. K20-0274 TaxID=3088255 RepID=UPI0039997137
MLLARIPDPPDFNDLLQGFLGQIFGPDSWILYVFVFATWAWAWYGLARSAFQRSRDLVAKASSIPAVRRVGVGASVLLVAGSQTCYLILSYYIAANIEPTVRSANDITDVDYTTWFTAPEVSPTEYPGFWIWFVISLCIMGVGWVSVDEPGLRVITWMPLAGGIFALCAPFLGMSEQADPVTAARMKFLAALIIAYEVAAIATVYTPSFCVKSIRRK